ncbi:hypothetical protein EMIHUDRAFT_199129 [Emiliania huxleyi CCMP1516]|uniref:protein disulfide-isomerase n=2 Tax=Emiliania huxleyi TaxID=2903 RepID=A0A0D3I2C8_EMIH1|nr:hypothetical protein EMIHUDRAFT_199129 [Emiliania huxleyi CCMP1516]EOD05413.1 hypothetical protein EMIHUDRAFT_199129 [Emiliania huxleyi CCMP1516]|eukprot:XP_005757842.1 hypothetical protein EMIHUDRAFT_199129 [Emiliania huxleyi CCMP1516]
MSSVRLPQLLLSVCLAQPSPEPVSMLPLFLSLAAASSVKLEDGVAVLTPDNFDDWVKAQEFALVEFYAPWCGHCKSLAPEWAAAAKKTRKYCPLAKVDADEHKSLAERFDVSGYPTIKTFKKGEASDYEGPREAKGARIISFAKELAGKAADAASPIERIKSADVSSLAFPAVLYFPSGATAPSATMAIPRDRKLFTEEALGEWLGQQAK